MLISTNKDFTARGRLQESYVPVKSLIKALACRRASSTLPGWKVSHSTERHITSSVSDSGDIPASGLVRSSAGRSARFEGPFWNEWRLAERVTQIRSQVPAWKIRTRRRSQGRVSVSSLMINELGSDRNGAVIHTLTRCSLLIKEAAAYATASTSRP